MLFSWYYYYYLLAFYLLVSCEFGFISKDLRPKLSVFMRPIIYFTVGSMSHVDICITTRFHKLTIVTPIDREIEVCTLCPF